MKKKFLSVFMTLCMILTSLPATAWAEDAQPVCGKEEHLHAEECYETVQNCELEEAEGHAHGDGCFVSTQICTDETEEHEHTEECYETVQNCELEEAEGYAHGEDCFAVELICEAEEHEHVADCYKAEESEEPAEEEWVISELIFDEVQITADSRPMFYSDVGVWDTYFTGVEVDSAEEKDPDWIDRVDLPVQMVEFYRDLVEAADGDGNYDYLMDAKYYSDSAESDTEAFLVSGSCHMITAGVFTFKEELATEQQTTAEEFLNTAIKDAYAAFLRDHPEVYWLGKNISIAILKSEKGVIPTLVLKNDNTFDIRAEEYRSGTIVSEVAAKAEIIKKAFNTEKDAFAAYHGITLDSSVTFDDHLTDAGKVAYFDYWLVQHNEYNTVYPQEPYSAHVCLGALTGQTGASGPVCEGYAKALKVLCDLEEIPCILGDGTGNDGGHMWNYAYIDDAWYAIDTTWNDTGKQQKTYLFNGTDTFHGDGLKNTHLLQNTVFENGTAFTNQPDISETAFAFAEGWEVKASVQEEKEIKTVKIEYVEVPIAGAEATKEVTVETVTDTSAEEVDNSNLKATIEWEPELPEDGKFEPLTAYKAKFTFEALNGYKFAENADAKWLEAGLQSVKVDGKLLTAEMDYEQTGTETIDEVVFTGEITAPVAGAAPEVTLATTATRGVDEENMEVTWNPALVGDKFADGTAYTASFTVTPKTGYVFDENTTVTGINDAAKKVADNKLTVVLTFPATATSITDTDIKTITFAAPAPGEEPAATAASDSAEEYTLANGGAITWVPAADTFAPLTAYTATVTLEAADNATFADSAKTAAEKIAIGGVTPAAAIAGDAKTMTLTWTFNVAAYQIDSVSVGITAPETGKPLVETAAVDGGANYTAGEVVWDVYEAATFTDAEPYTIYQATIALTAKDGYEFNDAALKAIEVTGVTGAVDEDATVIKKVTREKDTLNIVYVLDSRTAKEEISAVTLSLTAPVTLAEPGTASTTETKYKVTETKWFVKDGETKTAFNGNKFAADRVYVAEIKLSPASAAYEFAGSVTVTGFDKYDFNAETDTVTVEFPATVYEEPAVTANIPATIGRDYTVAQLKAAVTADGVTGDVTFTYGDENTPLTGDGTVAEAAGLAEATEATEVTLKWTFTPTGDSANYYTEKTGEPATVTVSTLATRTGAFASAEVAVVYADGLDVTEPALTWTPALGEGAVVTYSSSNTEVATVDADGNVTVRKDGTAVITASTDADAEYMAAEARYTLKVKPVYTGEGAKLTAEDLTVTYNSITVKNKTEGYEYACAAGTAEPANWNTTGSFTDLKASTGYTVYARVAETADMGASEAAKVTVTTPAAPATGGGSSNGGSSNNGASKPANKTETTTNSDGSTTTTTTDKNGTVTETTKQEDGSTTVVETKKDGTVTTTETDAEGNKTETVEAKDGTVTTTETTTDGTVRETVENTDGTVKETVTTAEGTKAVAETDADGVKTTTVTVTADSDVDGDGAADLPVSVNVAEKGDKADSIIISTDDGTEETTVTIPLDGASAGTVAVVVNPDGTETVVRDVVTSGDSVTVTVADGTTLKFVDNSKDFDDVSRGDWFNDAVDFASSHELFSGTSETTFTPNATMTRGMLAMVLHNLQHNPEAEAPADFNDVSSQYFAKAVAWAAGEGIISGYGDGQFGPNDSITREQLAVMLYRFAGSPGANGPALTNKDAGDVSGYAAPAMRWAVENGIISGDTDGRLNPKGDATRAQVASMMMRFCKAH